MTRPFRRSASAMPKRDALRGEAVTMLTVRMANLGSIDDWPADRVARRYNLRPFTAQCVIDGVKASARLLAEETARRAARG